MEEATTPPSRWHRLTPDRLILALLVTEILLWIPYRFRWFPDGREAVIAGAGIVVVLLLMLGWFLASLRRRSKFQFSLRSLLILAVAVSVAMPLIVDYRFRPKNLVGLSLSDVQARYGKPSDQGGEAVPPIGYRIMGPCPTSLKPGDTYIYVFYADHHDQQVHIFAVSPALYKRVKRVHPGNDVAYVLEVQTYPKNMVF